MQRWSSGVLESLAGRAVIPLVFAAALALAAGCRRRSEEARRAPSAAPSGAKSPAPAAASAGLRVGPAAFGGYEGDGPGVVRLIRAKDLPPPYQTRSANDSPHVVAAPEGAVPRVPPGFAVDVFARDLAGPRLLRTAPNGDVFVAETSAGNVRVLRAAKGSRRAETNELFASGLEGPFGMAFYPPSGEPEWLYVANRNSVVRFAYRPGDLKARGKPEVVVAELTETSDGHTTRDVLFSPDGQRLFVAIGSGSNVAEGLDPPRDLQAHQAEHGLGAASGDETDRAAILTFNKDGRERRVFATGIRNPVALAVQPGTSELWCATNERDGLGNDLVPDYVTRVRERAFYGWPWFYIGDNTDPRHPGARRDLLGKITVPDVLIQAHSAALGIIFYEGTSFPAEYRGDAFVTLHGSWNRSPRSGPKLIRVRLKSGVPTGEYEDFMTGFVLDDERVWARPVGVTVAADGAVLVSEDGNGAIFRISPDGSGPRGPGG